MNDYKNKTLNKSEIECDIISRKIIQIVAMPVTSNNSDGSFLALCNDGSLWHAFGSIGQGLAWYQIDTSPIENVFK